MRNFSYERAQSYEQAIAAAAGGAALAAGTTELLNWMRLGITAPDRVVDISHLDLADIAMERDSLLIGSMATLNQVGQHPLVLANAPVLAQACLKAASAQLRNRATLGGNVLQKTRCPYFRVEASDATRMPWPCNKRVPGSGCAALASNYPRLSLFGWTEACAATQPSDPAVALSALSAQAELASTDGFRSVPMADFHLTQEEAKAASGIGNEARVENRLEPGEMILRYRVPIDEASRNSVYLKVRERESYEYAMVSVAACVALENGAIRAARVAVGSIAQKPWRLAEFERGSTGLSLDAEALSPILQKSFAAARPLPGNAFKVVLARNATLRALMMAGGNP